MVLWIPGLGGLNFKKTAGTGGEVDLRPGKAKRRAKTKAAKASRKKNR